MPVINRNSAAPIYEILADALAANLRVGQTCIVKGRLTATDNMGAQYEVKASGSGGLTMANGNELYILAGQVITPDSIADLEGFVGVEGQQISVKGWHPGSSVGGGVLFWNPSIAKSEHNGGTTFSPTVPWTTTTSDYLSGVGETDPSGQGCWVRVGSDYSEINNFGADDWSSFELSIDGSGNYTKGNDLTFIPVLGGKKVNESKEIFSASYTAQADPSYAVGSPGDVNYFSVLDLRSYNSILKSLSFDGNGQATPKAYDPSDVNVWFVPFFASTGGDRVKFRDIDVTANGGHAIETGNVNMVTASGVTADNHNGIGSTGGYGHNYYGISSYQTHDSHFFLNSVSETGLFSFIAKETTNGGGFDLAGGDNIVVCGGVSTDSSKSAGWLLKSPNTGAELNRALVSSIVSHNNSKDPTTGGSFLVGDYNNPAVYQGSDYFLTGNLISITDTLSTGGSHFNGAISTTEGCKNTTFTNNHITGVVAPSDANIYIDNGSESPVTAYNVAQFDDSYADCVYTSKPTGHGGVWRGNIGSKFNPESIYKPSIMVDEDGYWRYSITHKPSSTSLFRLCNLKYTGGFTRYHVELTIEQGGSGGIQQKRIILKGFIGGATTVHENTTVYAYDSPPAISVNTAVNAETGIDITPTNTDLMHITLVVKGSLADRNTISMFP